MSAGEVVRLEEVTDERGGHALTQRLTSRERYSLAVYVARQLGLDARPMWTAWGLALYRVGDFQGARTKLSQGLRFSALHCSSMHSSWYASAARTCPLVEWDGGHPTCLSDNNQQELQGGMGWNGTVSAD